MARIYIPAQLRRLVVERADSLCEYCLISEAESLGCHFDHIISVKHGGSTTEDNLAYACVFCNLNKGTDLGSIVWGTGNLVRFFNPRRDAWADHFRFDEDGAAIEALTEIGEVTARILEFNSSDRIAERKIFQEAGSYPSPEAQRRMMK